MEGSTLNCCRCDKCLRTMTALWAVSVFLKDASIVDPWWSIGFLLVAANTVARTGLTPAKGLLLAMVGAWAVRLWLYLLARSRGKAEDPRYAAFPIDPVDYRFAELAFESNYSSARVLARVAGGPSESTGDDSPRTRGRDCFGQFGVA